MSILNENCSIKIKDVGYMEWDKASVTVAARPIHALSLRLCGGAEFVCNGQAASTNKNDVFYMPAGCLYRADYNERNEILYIHFESDLTSKMENFKFDNPDIIEGLFRKIYNIWQKGEEGYYFSNRTKDSFPGISSIIIHKYEDKTYHLSMKEDGQTKILEEKNETTGEVRLIKKISELTNKIIIYRDKKHIVVIEHMCEGEFDNNNCTNVKASIYNVDTLESSALEQLLFHADYDEILIHYEIKYHGSEIYVFYKTDEYFQVKIFNVETNEVKWEKFEFEFCDYEYINHGICHSDYSEYDDYLNGILTSIEYTSINIFDDKYYYIVEPHKVSRIDRKSGTIELVYEVVQKYRFLF